MKRIGLLAVLIAASWSATAQADNHGRFVKVKLAQVPPTSEVPEAPVPVATEANVNTHVNNVNVHANANANAAMNYSSVHGGYGYGYGYGYSPGFAWAQCCEVTRPCCMNLWDNYCYDVRRFCVPKCHAGARRYRCGGCKGGFFGLSKCGGHGCGLCGGHGCDTCCDQGCDVGGHQEVAPPAEQPPQPPSDVKAASFRLFRKR